MNRYYFSASILKEMFDNHNTKKIFTRNLDANHIAFYDENNKLIDILSDQVTILGSLSFDLNNIEYDGCISYKLFFDAWNIGHHWVYCNMDIGEIDINCSLE